MGEGEGGGLNTASSSPYLGQVHFWYQSWAEGKSLQRTEAGKGVGAAPLYLAVSLNSVFFKKDTPTFPRNE